VSDTKRWPILACTVTEAYHGFGKSRHEYGLTGGRKSWRSGATQN